MPPVAAQDAFHRPGSMLRHEGGLSGKRLQKINVIRSSRIPQHNAAVAQQPLPLDSFQGGIPEQVRKAAGIQGKQIAQRNGGQQAGHAEPLIRLRQGFPFQGQTVTQVSHPYSRVPTRGRISSGMEPRCSIVQ